MCAVQELYLVRDNTHVRTLDRSRLRNIKKRTFIYFDLVVIDDLLTILAI